MKASTTARFEILLGALLVAGAGLLGCDSESSGDGSTSTAGAGGDGGGGASGGAGGDGTNTDDDEDGFTEAEGDCNDADPAVNPDAVEVCADGIDNNCNGATDDTEPDGDGDGFGPCAGDCDDDDPAISPAADEVVDDIDNDCDGVVDADFDGDGYTEMDGDCDDDDETVYPGAYELCSDGVDNDCNGYADDQEPDVDGDGYGPCTGDCDETDASVGPNQPEIGGDGIDNNCDNLVDEDIDGDGWTVTNGDCDDDDPTINPSIVEDCDDQIDNNCDGNVDIDCLTPCELAQLTSSYIGCEYYTATTMNTLLAAQFNNNFALVVHNANADPASVNISKAGATVQSGVLAAGAVQTFLLPFDLTLKNTNSDDIIVSGGAYHLVSDQPVTVYQFNPFDFTLSGVSSYTNDASLLLPKHVLTNNYMVSTKPTFWNNSPGFFAVIGTGDNTVVSVDFTGHAWNGPNMGTTQVYNLDEGDVLQVPSRNCSSGSFAFCSSDYDFTGTRITVTQGSPVAVIAGHDCLYLPPNYGYCDHLEEMMLPLETWGSEFIATLTTYTTENQFRVLSGADGNQITFNPAVTGSVTRDAGQFVEFSASQNFTVSCTGPCLVTEFILGGDYFNLVDSDPAMAMLVPYEQFRSEYTFIVPSSMTRNYVSIVKPVGANAPDVVVDGNVLGANEFSAAIGASGFGVAHLDLKNDPRFSGTTSHTATSTEPFGISVYGYAPDTSYYYPGGLDLEVINIIN